MSEKIKIHTLGTSAGTIPYPGFRHTSIAIETEKGLYFLDAGENCAYTAHLCGINLLKTKAIFITHPHMDHVGGLGNLLWYIRKIGIIKKQPLTSEDNIDIFTPCAETVEGFMTVLKNTEGDFKTDYTHTMQLYRDGVIFDNGDIRVTAIHTNHLPQKNGEYMSYAFRIDCNGKIIVFSGDMRLEDIESILPERVDAFLVETGHNKIEDICNELKCLGRQVDKLFFVHHHRDIMLNIEDGIQRVYDSFGENAIVTRDGKTYEI